MKKILIVDDDKDVVDLVSAALEAEDRAIRRAYDGTAALNWLGKESFDLIICDLMMPKAHGFQIVEWVKANSECKQTRIIILTAKSYRRDADKSRQVGADLFISKPFELADLQKKVNQILS